ncbi:uncharacterized protein LOC110691164 [Chenopodium quinoa]|uniref:uncharacterized protein LOC110691164 n=1 Tax=Chenopodium quinoa TaxID=63459 RepID=UPI000B773464|nr:uncharacterized protein LOC110691164 [Chenopodium quinoa]
MYEEFNALTNQHTWNLIPRSKGVNIFRCMWLFKHKYSENCKLEQHKARLVVNGKSQQVGVDCDETFSPVVKLATIRTVLSIAMARIKPHEMRQKPKAELLYQLKNLKLALLRVAKVTSGAPNKLSKIKVVRLGIVQVLTVMSQKKKLTLREAYKKKFLPPDLHPRNRKKREIEQREEREGRGER